MLHIAVFISLLQYLINIKPFTSKISFISDSFYCQQYIDFNFSSENLVLDQMIIPLFEVFHHSHHFSAWYRIDNWNRNHVQVTIGSRSVTY